MAVVNLASSSEVVGSVRWPEHFTLLVTSHFKTLALFRLAGFGLGGLALRYLQRTGESTPQAS